MNSEAADVLAIARNDLRNARRSRILWGIVGVYVAFVALLFYANAGRSDPTVQQTLVGAVALSAVLLPLVAIAGSYLAVAGERESNTVRFLLSQPTTRRAVVLGKFLSRGAAVTGALVLAVLAGAVVALLTFPGPELAPLATFAGLTLLLVGAYVSVAVAVSAASASRSRAIAGTVAFYFVTDVFSLLDGFGIESVLRFVLGDVLGLDLTDVFYQTVVAFVSPATAYVATTVEVIGPEGVRVIGIADRPFYLEPWFLSIVLGAWIVVPVLAGVVAFGRAEIG